MSARPKLLTDLVAARDRTKQVESLLLELVEAVAPLVANTTDTTAWETWLRAREWMEGPARPDPEMRWNR